jgi:flagellar protein FliS
LEHLVDDNHIGKNLLKNGGKNMVSNYTYSQYKENSVNTASPEELTLMLYNGLVKFIMMAIHEVEGKNIEKANVAITKAERIIVEFQATLDLKYEVSENLDLMYDYMYRRLTEANIQKDKEILEEVLEFSKDLRDTWAKAMKIARQSQGQRQAQAAQ